MNRQITYSKFGSLNEYADTPYDSVGGPQGPQGPQDAHAILLLVPGAGGGVVRSQPITYSASGSLNESADTPYDPAGGSKAPRRHMANTFLSLMPVALV